MIWKNICVVYFYYTLIEKGASTLFFWKIYLLASEG